MDWVSSSNSEKTLPCFVLLDIATGFKMHCKALICCYKNIFVILFIPLLQEV